MAIKLFFAFATLLLVGILVSGAVVEFLLPSIFDRHMAGSSMMSGSSNMASTMAQELLDDFRSITTEALLVAGGIGLLVAGVVAWLVSSQLIKPIQAMRAVTDAVNSGNFLVRVPIYTPGEARDELEQIAVQVNTMADTLSRVEQRRRQLIGDVAHELRTPLTIINGTMEGLIDGIIPPAAEVFEKVQAETARLNKLVDDLRDLSALDADQAIFSMTPVDLNTLVPELLGQFSRLLAEKDIQVSQTSTSLPLRVSADEDRLKQVLSNVLTNTINYAPGGHLEIELDAQDDHAIIRVKDDGMGIAPEHLPFVFDRFYRADRSRARNTGGSGVGLTIAREIMERHAGTIRIESSGEGQGSIVTILLPLLAK